MKNLYLLMLLTSTMAMAQQNTGINTTQPASTLDIQAATDNTTDNIEGLLIPRVSKQKALLMAGSIPEESTMIYIDDLTTNYTEPTDGSELTVEDIKEKGYFHWSGTKWVQLIDTNSQNIGLWSYTGTETRNIQVGSNDITLIESDYAFTPSIINGENMVNVEKVEKTLISTDPTESYTRTDTNISAETLDSNNEVQSKATIIGDGGINLARKSNANSPSTIGYMSFRDAIDTPYTSSLVLWAKDYTKDDPSDNLAHRKTGLHFAGENSFNLEANAAFFKFGNQHTIINSDSIKGFQTYNKLPISNAVGPHSVASLRTSSTDAGINNSYFDFLIYRDVQGNDWKSTTSRIQRRIDSNKMGFLEFGLSDGELDNNSASADNGVSIGFDDTALFTVLSSGNVGIGTMTAAEKLEVAGNVKATTFIAANGSVFPDYVFEEYFDGDSKTKLDYDFKSLNEVETFVKENGHLPGYTSAKEVTRAGQFDMTATQITNVEKIEELYLHTIEQEAKIQDQKAKLDVQASELAGLKTIVQQLVDNQK